MFSTKKSRGFTVASAAYAARVLSVIAVFLYVVPSTPAIAQAGNGGQEPPMLDAPSRRPTDTAKFNAEPVSALGKSVLDKVKPSVVQIKSFFGDNTEKNSHGSGFVVGAAGLAITNYHVVSDVVMFPDKYRLEYKTTDDKKGKVKVLAIDVLHDVSLVQLIGHEPPALQLMTQIPAKGERAYSVGFPLDVGLTITEGVSNGLVEDAFDERLHYAGAINGGMSGGPALDANARVIGINVSAYMFSQNVSFFVPARHAHALLSKAALEPLNLKQARKEVAAQLLVHADELLNKLPKEIPTQQLNGMLLPNKLAPFFDCGGGGNPESDSPVQTQSSRCNAKAGLYVSNAVQTGDIHFRHQLMSTSKLDSYRFYKHVQSWRTRGIGGGLMRGYGRQDYGPNVCKQRVITNNGIDMYATICSRAYRKFDKLFDVDLNVISSQQSKEAFTSTLSLTGVPFEPAMDLVERYLAAIKPAKTKAAEAKAGGAQ